MAIESEVWKWLDEVVIDLNLCPFARKPRKAEQIRLAIFNGSDLRELDQRFLQELEELASTSATILETTLLAVPNMLGRFEDYLDYLDQAQWMLERADLEGTIQIASFHPDYRFADTRADEAGNLTNVAPCPIFHLIREASLEQVLEKYPDPERIPEDNIKTMQGLTHKDKARLFPHRYKL